MVRAACDLHDQHVLRHAHEAKRLVGAYAQYGGSGDEDLPLLSQKESVVSSGSYPTYARPVCVNNWAWSGLKFAVVLAERKRRDATVSIRVPAPRVSLGVCLAQAQSVIL